MELWAVHLPPSKSRTQSPGPEPFPTPAHSFWRQAATKFDWQTKSEPQASWACCWQMAAQILSLLCQNGRYQNRIEVRMGVKFTRPLVSMVRYFKVAATLVLLIWSELRWDPATFDTLVASKGRRPSSLAQVLVLKRQYPSRPGV